MSRSAALRSSDSAGPGTLHPAPPGNQAFQHPHANVLGIQVSALNLEGAVNLADRWLLSQAGSSYVCVVGVHGVMEARADSDLRRVFNQALMSVPDGMPLSWVARWQGHRNMDRVFGPDFMTAMCRLSMQRGYRHFLCGGQPGVAEQLRAVLQKRFPGLSIVGTWTPPFRRLNPAEVAELSARLRTTRPHILWIGLSTPRQERFMAEYAHHLQVPLQVGVGAAFDFHTGRIRDCSSWIKRCGLQWLHRLLQEPRRLAPRYLRNNPAFVWHILGQMAGLRRYPEGSQLEPLCGRPGPQAKS